MKVRPDGDFDVSPGEKITITVQADSLPCVVTFGPAKGCGCLTDPRPDEKTAKETCTSPSTPGTQWEQTIIFGFAGANAHYSVTITGNAGGIPFDDDVNSTPNPRDRTYTFHVSAQ
jgi:hypothetical protein